MDIPKKYIEAYKKKYGENADLDVLKKVYEHSLITQGEDIGVIAAQSIGEASTQLTLRTKHTAGLAAINTTSGLPRLVEIFDAKKEISTPTMEVFLKPEYAKSKQKATAIATQMIEIKAKELFSSYSVSLKRHLIEFHCDRETLRAYGLTLKNIQAKFEVYISDVTIDGDTLTIKDKAAETVKKLIKLRNKLNDVTISGINGVQRTILNTDSDGTFWLKTVGTNLARIMELEGVDQTRTISNDIIEVSKILGIEAARNMILEEVNKALEAGGLTVDKRHIMLVADAMCVDGDVRGIGRYGLSGETESVFARASFEIPLKHLIEASLYHETDAFKYVANNVMSNQVIPIGTGSVKLIVKENGTKNKEDDAGKDKKE